jgi:hypothetical protein
MAGTAMLLAFLLRFARFTMLLPNASAAQAERWNASAMPAPATPLAGMATPIAPTILLFKLFAHQSSIHSSNSGTASYSRTQTQHLRHNIGSQNRGVPSKDA